MKRLPYSPNTIAARLAGHVSRKPYIKPSYRDELAQIIGREVIHPDQRAHLEVHGLCMGSEEAERIKKRAQRYGFMVCGQIPAKRKGFCAEPGEEMILYFHVRQSRLMQDLKRRHSNTIQDSILTKL